MNHLGGRSRFLSEVAHRLWRVTNQFGITLRAVHRPGVENRRADLLSCWKQGSTDLKLDPKFFRLAEKRWGPHTVDLFATRLNHQLDRFVSWRPDPLAAAVDAFQFPLSGENPWCFPPEALIPRLLGQLTRQRATVTLVAPQWPGKPWWPDLIRVMVDKPIKLSNHHFTLQAIGTNEFFRISLLESGYLSDIRSALDTRGCSQALIRHVMPCLPSDADSKWRCYKRYCSTADKPLLVVQNYTDFKFTSAVDQLAEFLSYRRDSGTGTTRGDNNELPTRELALKSWSLWGIATFPRPSDGVKLVRSTLARHNGTGALKFQYFGTKELRLPVFSVQLCIHPDVQKKVCAVEAIEGRLRLCTSSSAFKHGD